MWRKGKNWGWEHSSAKACDLNITAEEALDREGALLGENLITMNDEQNDSEVSPKNIRGNKH